MNKKDREKMAQILSEMYDNDFNPEIETTKYQPYSEREDDDGVNWYNVDKPYLKYIHKVVSDNDTDDVHFSDWMNGPRTMVSRGEEWLSEFKDSEWDEYFSLLFDIPIKDLEKIRSGDRNTAKTILQKYNLDKNPAADRQKVEELLNW